MRDKSLTIMQEYKRWASANNQLGRHAFARFVMLKYLEAVQSLSTDIVFKGGNLLWHYIQTPRHTIDLDLSTLESKSHNEVKKLLEKACSNYKNITYQIVGFNEINRQNGRGAAVTIKYATNTGQKNQFEVDIMYSLPTDLKKVDSTLKKSKIQSASLENIISDKVSAAHNFKSGNTRMKDFDDLWRIWESGLKIKSSKLIKLFMKKDLEMSLDLNWIDDEMQKKWSRHIRLYKDLPRDLNIVFKEINEWLKLISKEDTE